MAAENQQSLEYFLVNVVHENTSKSESMAVCADSVSLMFWLFFFFFCILSVFVREETVTIGNIPYIRNRTDCVRLGKSLSFQCHSAVVCSLGLAALWLCSHMSPFSVLGRRAQDVQRIICFLIAALSGLSCFDPAFSASVTVHIWAIY